MTQHFINSKNWTLVKKTATQWNDDKCMKLAAALAYYTVFSIAPLLIIVTAVTSLIFAKEAASGQISTQIRGLFGTEGANAIEAIIANIGKSQGHSILATVVGVATLLFGATAVFSELQDSLNTIWRVKIKPGQGLKVFLRTRLLSFSMILGIGFLLMTSLVVSAALAAVTKYMSGFLPGTYFLWQVVNFLVSFGVITGLFAMMFKFLPDVEINWEDVWIGAAITSILFSVGKLLIGLYLGQSGFSSAYGAAGSFVILLLWVYYSSQILFLGAEFAQVYACSRAGRAGHKIVPKENAEWVEVKQEPTALRLMQNPTS